MEYFIYLLVISQSVDSAFRKMNFEANLGSNNFIFERAARIRSLSRSFEMPTFGSGLFHPNQFEAMTQLIAGYFLSQCRNLGTFFIIIRCICCPSSSPPVETSWALLNFRVRPPFADGSQLVQRKAPHSNSPE